VHRGDGRGTSFSVHLRENVFQCFDAACAKKGNVIDLWGAVSSRSLDRLYYLKLQKPGMSLGTKVLTAALWRLDFSEHCRSREVGGCPETSQSQCQKVPAYRYRHDYCSSVHKRLDPD
jgi:hypothetical protein